MKNLIITSSNSNTEYFLVNHWLKSLKTTTPLNNIDIVVLDSGISNKTKNDLLEQGVLIYEIKETGHIVNLRMKYTVEFLNKHRDKYNYVLYIDGGDIIFQDDINKLFELKELENNPKLLIANQNMLINKSYIKSHSSFNEGTMEDVIKATLGKPVLNAGVILGEINEIKTILEKSYEIIKDTSRFLIDQMAINYILHKHGYQTLDKKYNFMKLFYNTKVINKNGKLYFNNNQLIPIVHNLGGKDFIRPYKNFGYGKSCNQVNVISQTISTIIVFIRIMLRKFITI